MRCIFCGFLGTKVIDKRDSTDSSIVRRRRECLECRKRFTTYERVESKGLTVVKKDGRREPFSRKKLESGILKSIQKRPISREQIDSLVNKVEDEIRGRGTFEVRSKIIGDLVMKNLKSMDKVAYVRFASVYKDFKSAEDFEREVKNLSWSND